MSVSTKAISPTVVFQENCTNDAISLLGYAWSRNATLSPPLYDNTQIIFPFKQFYVNKVNISLSLKREVHAHTNYIRSLSFSVSHKIVARVGWWS